MSRVIDRWRDFLGQAVAPDALAVARIVLGLALAAEAWNFLRPTPGGNWVRQYFCAPSLGLKIPYPGWEWLTPFPEPWTTIELCALLLAGLLMAVGYGSRCAALIGCLIWTHTWLIDQTCFNNHYYLVSLLTGLMTFMPVDRAWSVAAWWASRRAVPQARQVPFWCQFVLRFQMFLLYFWGGINKLFSFDYLVRAMPLHAVLQSGESLRNFRPWLPVAWADAIEAAVQSYGFALIMSWAGMFYDLGVGLLLIFPRTRWLGFVMSVCFHGLNYFSFFNNIGYFPLIALGLTTVFFAPDWPLQCAAAIKRRFRVHHASPAVVVTESGEQAALAIWAALLVAGWLIVQSVLPLRPLLIAGDANWTDQGNCFAWRMKMSNKRATSVAFRITDGQLLGGQAATPETFDWSQWHDDRRSYRPVDLDQRGPLILAGELSVIVEPIVGERMLLRLAEEPAARDGQITRLQQRWRTVYGRDPQIVSCRSLESSLREMEQAVSGPGTPAPAWSKLAALLVAAVHNATEPQARLAARQRCVHFSTQLLTEPSAAGDWPLRLLQLTPFATAGWEDRSGRWAVVFDAELQAIAHQRFEKFVAAVADAPVDRQVAWAHFASWLPEDWAIMPRRLIVEAGGRFEIWSNPAAEMHVQRMMRMLGSPAMCQGYARHVADQWMAEYGRRPTVSVTHRLTMNGRGPAPLIDPRVDLATAQTSAWHVVPWILPPPPP